MGANSLDPGRRPPPVRIGLAQARHQQAGMLLDAQEWANGAGDYGQREDRFASVPIAIRIRRAAPVNGEGARAAAIPINPTVRKRGYPPISLLPAAKAPGSE